MKKQEGDLRFNKNFLNLIIVLLIAFLSINLINALGVASPYSGSQLALEMYPGEEKIVMLELQNWDINEEIVLEGKILQGEEIASLKDKIVKVPYQVKIPVEMVVKISAEAKIGDKYNIQYEFKQISGEGEGMVVFSQGIKRNFDVIIVRELREEKPVGFLWIILFIILLIIIVLVVLIIWRVRKKKRLEQGF